MHYNYQQLYTDFVTTVINADIRNYICETENGSICVEKVNTTV